MIKAILITIFFILNLFLILFVKWGLDEIDDKVERMGFYMGIFIVSIPIIILYFIIKHLSF